MRYRYWFIPLLLFLLLFLWIGLVSVACSPSRPAREISGINYSTNLLILFKTEVTDSQIEEFLYSTLMKPHSRSGYQMQDGIYGIARIRSIPNHQGLAVDFTNISTESQREAIKARVKESPLVLKVLENVIPAQVEKIE